MRFFSAYISLIIAGIITTLISTIIIRNEEPKFSSPFLFLTLVINIFPQLDFGLSRVFYNLGYRNIKQNEILLALRKIVTSFKLNCIIILLFAISVLFYIYFKLSFFCVSTEESFYLITLPFLCIIFQCIRSYLDALGHPECGNFSRLVQCTIVLLLYSLHKLKYLCLSCIELLYFGQLFSLLVLLIILSRITIQFRDGRPSLMHKNFINNLILVSLTSVCILSIDKIIINNAHEFANKNFYFYLSDLFSKAQVLAYVTTSIFVKQIKDGLLSLKIFFRFKVIFILLYLFILTFSCPLLLYLINVKISTEVICIYFGLAIITLISICSAPFLLIMLGESYLKLIVVSHIYQSIFIIITMVYLYINFNIYMLLFILMIRSIIDYVTLIYSLRKITIH